MLVKQFIVHLMYIAEASQAFIVGCLGHGTTNSTTWFEVRDRIVACGLGDVLLGRGWSSVEDVYFVGVAACGAVHGATDGRGCSSLCVVLF